MICSVCKQCDRCTLEKNVFKCTECKYCDKCFDKQENCSCRDCGCYRKKYISKCALCLLKEGYSCPMKSCEYCILYKKIQEQEEKKRQIEEELKYCEEESCEDEEGL